MNPDITPLLQDWPFQPGELNVRLVQVNDDRSVMQIRIELGILQLELTGRPDGTRPAGLESRFDEQLERLKQWEAQYGEASGFVISPGDCRALREEAAQFHHRAAGYLALEQYQDAVRDVDRNLRVIEFVREFAAEEEDRMSLDPLLPHLVATRTRALATLAITQREVKTAMSVLDHGIDQLRHVYGAIGRPGDAESSNEVQLLRGMRDALVPKLPTSQRVELQERLKAALAAENYELAAILRDELRLMHD